MPTMAKEWAGLPPPMPLPVRYCAADDCDNLLDEYRPRQKWCHVRCYRRLWMRRYRGSAGRRRPRADVCSFEDCTNPVPSGRWRFCSDRCGMVQGNREWNRRLRAAVVALRESRICAAPDCSNLIPPTARTDQVWCSRRCAGRTMMRQKRAAA